MAHHISQLIFNWTIPISYHLTVVGITKVCSCANDIMKSIISTMCRKELEN
jgi:hypothetical protein